MAEEREGDYDGSLLINFARTKWVSLFGRDKALFRTAKTDAIDKVVRVLTDDACAIDVTLFAVWRTAKVGAVTCAFIRIDAALVSRVGETRVCAKSRLATRSPARRIATSPRSPFR